MNGVTQIGAESDEIRNEHDPETGIIMEILRQINEELDEIAAKIEEIGRID